MYERARESRSSAAFPPPTTSATRGRSTSSAGGRPRIWDVDGNEMIDFHNGFGSMIQGHAHPAITRAVEERIANWHAFAAPTEDAVAVAEELPASPGPEVALHATPGPRRRWTRSGSHAG